MGSAPDRRVLLQQLKAAAVSRGPELCLTVGSPVQALLRPVPTAAAHLDEEDIRCLTDWRNRHVQSFLTEFTATTARTAVWLSEIVGPDDTRILFMVNDLHGRTLGYMGLGFIDWPRARGEADAVVRGSDAPRGLMSTALRTLLAWAENQLGLHAFGVRVRSDNTAVEFYRKLGFCDVRRVPLRRTVEGETVRWVEDGEAASGGISLVHMERQAAVVDEPDCTS